MVPREELVEFALVASWGRQDQRYPIPRILSVFQRNSPEVWMLFFQQTFHPFHDVGGLGNYFAG